MCHKVKQLYLNQLVTLQCLLSDFMLLWPQSEAEASYYHTHKLISTASFDAQTVQTDALFTGKLETRFKNHPKNKTAAGILVSRLKEDGGLPTKVLLWLHSSASAGCCNITLFTYSVCLVFKCIFKCKHCVDLGQAWAHSLAGLEPAGNYRTRMQMGPYQP